MTLSLEMAVGDDVFAMYVLNPTLERPTAHPTYCLHSDFDRTRAERRQPLRGRPQAFRKQLGSNACASLAFLTSRRVRLRSRSRVTRSPLSQPGPRSSPDPPRFRTTSRFVRAPSPTGLRVARGHYHSTR